MVGRISLDEFYFWYDLEQSTLPFSFQACRETEIHRADSQCIIVTVNLTRKGPARYLIFKFHRSDELTDRISLHQVQLVGILIKGFRSPRDPVCIDPVVYR